MNTISRIRRVMSLLPLCVFGAALAGCSTVATTVGGAQGDFQCPGGRVPRVYAGVANDTAYLRNCGSNEGAIAIIDFPFSLAADTALLPYSIVTQIKDGDLCTGATCLAEPKVRRGL